MPSFRTKKAAHLVLCALFELNDSNGISKSKLIDFLITKYNVPEKYRKYLLKALQKGVDFGAIEKTRGRYSFVNIFPGRKSYKSRSKTHSKIFKRSQSLRRR